MDAEIDDDPVRTSRYIFPEAECSRLRYSALNPLDGVGETLGRSISSQGFADTIFIRMRNRENELKQASRAPTVTDEGFLPEGPMPCA